ncbi:hypothetical protein VCHC17A1_3593B, partial [Vibrio cholerae HC-17A1]
TTDIPIVLYFNHLNRRKLKCCLEAGSFCRFEWRGTTLNKSNSPSQRCLTLKGIALSAMKDCCVGWSQ